MQPLLKEKIYLQRKKHSFWQIIRISWQISVKPCSPFLFFLDTADSCGFSLVKTLSRPHLACSSQSCGLSSLAWALDRTWGHFGLSAQRVNKPSWFLGEIHNQQISWIQLLSALLWTELQAYILTLLHTYSKF